MPNIFSQFDSDIAVAEPGSNVFSQFDEKPAESPVPDPSAFSDMANPILRHDPNIISTTSGGPQLRIAGAPGAGADLGRQIWQGIKEAPGAVSEPLIKVSEPLELNPQTVANAMDVVKGAGAAVGAYQYGGDPAKAYMEIAGSKNRKPTTAEEVFTGANNAVTESLDFFTSPLGIATLGTSSLPKAAQRAVSLAFTAQMASQAPDIAKALGEELGKPPEQRDPKKISNLITQGVLTTSFTVAGALHGLASENTVPSKAPVVPPVENVINPTADKSFGEKLTAASEAAQPKEPNAVPLDQTGKILQREPGQTGEAGGQRGGVEQGQQGNETAGAGKPETTTGQVPLKEPTGQEAIQRIVDLSPEDYQKEVAAAGDITGKIAYPLAEKITSSDFPAMEAAAKSVGEQNLARISAAKTPEEMGQLFKSAKSTQIFTEAIRMRQAMDEAISTGAKTKEEFAALQTKHGVGGPKGTWQTLMDAVGRERAKASTVEMLNPGGSPESLSASKRALSDANQGAKEGVTAVMADIKAGKISITDGMAKIAELQKAAVDAKVKSEQSAVPAAPVEPVNNLEVTSVTPLDPATGNPLSATDALVNKLEAAPMKPPPAPVTEVLKMLDREGGRRGDRSEPLPAGSQAEPVTHDLGNGEPIAAAGPGIVGMGAATPEEFVPPPSTPTGIKNATVDAERKLRGLPPAMEPARRSFGKVWDEATAKIDRDPQAQDDLVKELRDKPRALTDTEDAMLLHRQIDLQNEYAKAGRDMEQAQSDGRPESVQEEKLRLARISDQLLELYNVNKTSGTETGRGLNARKMMAREDFSLAAMETKMRVAKDGSPLTEAEHAKIKELQQKIEATQNAVDEHAAVAEKKGVSKSTDATMKDVAREAPAEARSKDFDIDREDKLAAGIKAKIDKGQTNEITPLVQQLARVLWRRGVRGQEPMIDGLHEILKSIAPEFTRDQTQRAFSGYGDFTPLSKAAIDVGLRDLRGQTQQVLKLEALEARKPLEKTGQERRVPSDTERRLIKQVNEFKRKYGVVTTDPATQLKSALQSRKTYYEHRISDLKHEIETREKIVKTKSPSPTDPELEKMKAEYETLKKEHGEIFTEPGLTDAQRLDMAVKSADRQIVELERQLKTGEIFPKGKSPSVLTSAELEAKRARIDALKEERAWARDLIQPSPEVDPNAAGLKALKTRLKNRTAELLEKTAANDFSRKVTRKTELDPEAIRLKAANENAKLEFDRAAMRERLKQRTPLEKVQDTFTKWRRAFLLSSPVTLAKLTSAAVERMAFTPTEEAVGGVYSKLPIISRVARQAPREGGMNVAAEARAITQGFTKGMKDAATTLKTGHSDLDSLFGRRDVMPREAIDMIGSMHGALKAPVKRAEFARSFEKRTAFAIKNGLDASDPMVQTKIAVEAYKDANRSIFMQDNAVVSAFSRAISALEQRDKATGQTPPGRKAIATAAKFALPIVKVPTNIIAETITHVTGLPTGIIRIVNAMRKGGLDNLPPEHADLIMRELKKGSLGGAFLLAGYLAPQMFGGYYQPNDKKQIGHPKFGTMKIGDVNVPTFLIHNPLLETLQIGATIRHVADSKLRKKDAETQGVGAGVLSAALGLTEEVPFVRTTTDMLRIMNPYERQKYFNQVVRDSVVPLGVSWAAKHFDKDAQGNYIPRDPKTIVQSIESGIPGLREKVPGDVKSVIYRQYLEDKSTVPADQNK